MTVDMAPSKEEDGGGHEHAAERDVRAQTCADDGALIQETHDAGLLLEKHRRPLLSQEGARADEEERDDQEGAEIEKQETDIVQTEEPNKTEMEEVEEPKKASVDISLNTVIMKDPLEKKEEENISYSISNI